MDPPNPDDSDDEFFGAQDDDLCQFGDMEKHETDARNHQLKTAGFLDAFDESKEELLQKGFEVGFLESFEKGKIIGELIGKAATDSKLWKETNDESENKSQDANEFVHRFFANEFQQNRDPKTCLNALDGLVSKTRRVLKDGVGED